VLRIADIMSRNVFVLAPEMPADEAARALAARGISGAPVQDRSGRLIGVLSRSDLADPERRPAHAGTRTVGDLMTPGLLTLHDSEPAMSAIQLMVREEVQRIVVLDDGGALVGIVTPSDVLAALVGAGSDPLRF
jgi:CBS domain-containing protein